MFVISPDVTDGLNLVSVTGHVRRKEKGCEKGNCLMICNIGKRTIFFKSCCC